MYSNILLTTLSVISKMSRVSRRQTRSQSKATPPVPPTTVIPTKSPVLHIPLPQLPVVKEEEKLYLYYSATPGERADYGGKFSFTPLSVRRDRLKEEHLPVEELRILNGSLKVGDAVHIAYYVEETGDSFGMSADWHILGAYTSEDMARLKGVMYKKSYKPGYFEHLVGVYVYSTIVLSSPRHDTIVEIE